MKINKTDVVNTLVGVAAVLVIVNHSVVLYNRFRNQ